MEKILNFISQFIQTEEGKRYLYELKEEQEIDKIRERYENYKKYNELLRKKTFSIPEFKKYDTSLSISKYFVSFRDYLRRIIEIRREITSIKQDADYFLPINESILSLYQRLELTFDDEGNIKDSASSALQSIREKKRSLYREIEKKMKMIIEDIKKENVLRDEEIHYKEGRFTLCLKALLPNTILVSYSRSGESYFVEPDEIVNLNVKFRHLEELEKEEEKRILNQIFLIYNDLKNEIDELVSFVTQLDYFQAIYLFANRISGEIPQFGKERKFRLVHCYHPLLKVILDKKCVSYNIEFGEEKEVLLVTGPNGGGKTTFLEAIHLLIRMIKRGIPVPASSLSYFYIPDKIFMAGFEERSKIEEGFSSFTLYLEEIKNSINDPSQHKLVLLDEFMGNTDPEEGGNLGVGILRDLRDRKIKTLCATHNDKIKAYLRDEKGILISAFTLDLDTLKPTYKIEVMKISPSFATFVARKCGLPESIFQKMPQSQELIDKIYMLKSEIEREREELNKEKEKLRKEKEKIEQEYKRELKKKIEEFSEEIRKILKEFEVKKEKKILKEAIKKIEEKKEELEAEKVELESLKIGEIYSLRGSSSYGKLIDLKGDRALLEIGGKKVEVPINFLREKKEEPKEEKARVDSYTFPLPPRVLSIRGMTKEEAEEILERFLYDARAAGYNEVRVVHGEGKGILKKLVFDVIKNMDFIEEFYHPSWNEGGEGVTVIRFRKL
ncbi:MAG: Smr/MutS family protein [Candidatus Hydrothermales bacterium]